ncbi:MAG: class I SAM-dependent RNA methyltransferase [Candidatus Magasanikbacteria bacterium]|nr:class I SAM-dependent RNA methyltransferase [Candidatus Magasanikbacteria bacterium]MBT4071946.1 class I SAM-dependent RNA methyltransferase [Candidatus Magasanikbacteria bacterium]
MKPTFRVTIEKLIFGGQGLARLEDGRVAFVWNALPGEEVDIEIIKKKDDYVEAIAKNIIKRAEERVEPEEESFLSTSPWQILDPEKEDHWKKEIAMETYNKIGDVSLQADDINIVSDDRKYGYRNKMGFSFTEKEDGTISLAFFKRRSKDKFPVDGSVLASKEINDVAKDILAWIHEKQIPLRSLKSLIIRSNMAGEVIAGLFIKDKLPFSDYPELTNTLKGFTLYYSTHKSPASVPTKLLYSNGVEELTEDILGVTAHYGLFSFFQINQPLFNLALKDIAAFVDPQIPLVDYYSGVGSIGLPLSQNGRNCVCIDSDKEAIAFAKKNIAENNLDACEAHCAPAEQLTKYIDKDHMIIVDPPRAGLHKDMIKTLLMRQPPRIIYLSCNLSTQARDMRMLSEVYRPVFFKLYNFFPRTPHIEGLIVLEKV